VETTRSVTLAVCIARRITKGVTIAGRATEVETKSPEVCIARRITKDVTIAESATETTQDVTIAESATETAQSVTLAVCIAKKITTMLEIMTPADSDRSRTAA